EGSFTRTIPYQQQPPVAWIPDADGEGTDEPSNEGFAKLEIHAGNNGDVSGLLNFSPPLRKPASEFTVIVDLTIAGDHHSRLPIDDRLFAFVQAADRQPGRSKHNGTASQGTDIVGAAMRERLEHGLDLFPGALQVCRSRKRNHSADAAHLNRLLAREEATR